ncbi:unnamed protein product [Sphenostylis stenocarpa]|uniref:TIR domain-containing protein n=1 Tax=Sphenostylis stenocarpa TaxID=92480 RepID=A0AA86T464_9FABA|nr:unnamed protein product [Sphenostylis stenocarpa]
MIPNNQFRLHNEQGPSKKLHSSYLSKSIVALVNGHCLSAFRGEDTRLTFIGHLRKELCRRGINTCIDDNNMGIGESLSLALSKAIEESNIFIVVFSQNYASSTWCLDELVKILERSKMREKKQVVLPVFYHVDPSDIRHERNNYEKHMMAHENEFGKDSQKVQAWRSALFEASNFPGHHITTGSHKYEINLIEDIVEKVYKNIAPKPLHIGQNTIGLNPYIEEVKTLLDMNPGDETVRMLGIYGLGGIGKTELAKALYDKIVQHFDAASFLADVREKSNRINGLEDLQKTLLLEMLEELQTELGSTRKGILGYNAKQVFLDIACFFKGERIEYVEKILEEFDSTSNIIVLRNKSLVTVEDGYLKMHDLIQDMGREIVRQEAPNPGERSRLWEYEDVIEILDEDSGSNKIQGIMLNPPQQEEVDWSGDEFEKMKWLRILIVRNTSFLVAPKHLPNHLRVLDWEEYPSKCFPSKFHPKKIVVFNLHKSHLTFEEPFKKFSYLTSMNFSYNQSIIEIPDVSEVQNLRELRLDHCRNLIVLHESVGFLKRLSHLSASKCSKLRSFLQRMFLPSLEVLDLNLCVRLEYFPEIVKEMNKSLKIYMTNTAIEELPYSIGNLTGLVCMEIPSNKKLRYLPSSLFMLPNVVTFKIGPCSRLQKSFKSLFQIPLAANVHPTLRTLHFQDGGLSDEDLFAILNYFPKLEELIVSNNNFVSLPACIKECVHLTSLDVSYCTKLRKIPECNNLKILDIDCCVNLKEISKLPSTIQKVYAKCCFSLIQETADMLWFQAAKGMRELEVLMPHTKIQEWFDWVSYGGSPCLWARGKFPIFALALIFEDAVGSPPRQNHYPQHVELHLVINGRCVPCKSYYNFKIHPHHVLICDVRILVGDQEWLGLDALFLEHDWNLVQVSYDTTSNFFLSSWGVCVFQEGTNMEDVQFLCPDPKYLDMSQKTVVPTKDPAQERKQMIQNLCLDQKVHQMLVDLLAYYENRNDLAQHSDFSFRIERLYSAIGIAKEISKQTKAELESRGSASEDEKHSLVKSFAHELAAMVVGEALISGHQGREEEQRNDSHQEEIRRRRLYDGITDGLVEARKSFPSLDIIKTRSVALNKVSRVVWMFIQPQETELYIEGIVNGLLEARMSFPGLDMWGTLHDMLYRRGMETLHDIICPLIDLRVIDEEVKAPLGVVGEAASTSDYQGSDPQQQKLIMTTIFNNGMMDGLFEAQKSFPSLDIVKTRSASLNRDVWIELLPDGKVVLPTVEMRIYTTGILNAVLEAKLSFPGLNEREKLNAVLSSIGEPPISQSARLCVGSRKDGILWQILNPSQPDAATTIFQGYMDFQRRQKDT